MMMMMLHERVMKMVFFSNSIRVLNVKRTQVTASVPLPSLKQLTIDYYQRQRGTKRMVDMFFEFTELCTTIPPLEYGGNEALLEYFASKVKEAVRLPTTEDYFPSTVFPFCSTLSPSIYSQRCAIAALSFSCT